MKLIAILGTLCVSLFCFLRDINAVRPFSVRDSIHMERFNELSFDVFGGSTSFSDSPDGKYSVVLTSRGIADADQIQSTLWLVDYQELRNEFRSSHAVNASRLSAIASISATPSGMTRGTGTYGSVISGIKWSHDSASIYFLGENSNGNRQLYKVVVHSRICRSLTADDRDVESFDVVGKAILYRASRPTAPAHEKFPDINHQRTAFVATGLPIVDILAGASADRLRSYDLWCLCNGRNRLVLKVPVQELDASSTLAQPLTLSPDARFAILLLTPKSIPSSWEQYETPPHIDYMKLDHRDLRPISPYNSVNPLREYAVVDLARNTSTALGLDAFYFNFVGARSVQWSRDSRRVLLSNVFLPRRQDDHEDTNRIHPCEAAVFDVTSNTSHCLAFGGSINSAPPGMHLQSAWLNSDGTEARLHYGTFDSAAGATVVFRCVDHEWKSIQSNPNQAIEVNKPRKTGISLSIKEALNERPTLWAKDSTTDREMKILDPNPDFEQLILGHASEYHWTDQHGRSWSGGLFLPLGYTKGRRYPLVIQTHGFTPSKFVVDGAYPTAMAARALESAGIVVLQVGTGGDPGHLSSKDEAMDAVEGYDSAIDALDVEGIIDPKKVGIVGFSRTCWYVENALVKIPDRFAAATVADGVSYSYMQYLFFSPSSSLMERNYLQVVGAPPVGDGINQWIRSAPEFHAERISAPLRIEAIQLHSVLEEWELYASLRLQGKSVDLIYFPRGQHVLQKPSERMASQEGNVDWFRFWLQGYEDPNPRKHDQYERWRIMRESLNQSNQSGPGQTALSQWAS